MRIIVVTLLGAWAPAAAGRVPSFRGLGDLPGGEYLSQAYAVSADGRVVVGASNSAASGTRPEAFRWTAEEGIQALGDFEGGVYSSEAFDVSGDGSTIVGRGASIQGEQAFLWQQGTGLQGLGYMDGGTRSFARAISADGTTVVGVADTADRLFEAFRWTRDGGFEGLGALDATRSQTDGQAVSSDGSVVVGYGFSATEGDTSRSFRWSRATGIQPLAGTTPHQATEVSGDGTVVVGSMFTREGTPAVMWNGDQVRELGHLSFCRQSTPLGVSMDGAIIVGTSQTNCQFSEWEAFVWTEARGMESLKDLLIQEHGLDLGGWVLTAALDVSDDGSVFVGYGFNPSGQTEAWIAVVPEPGVATLAALLTAWTLRRTR